MSNRFIFKSSLAPYMREFLELKKAAGIKAIEIRSILFGFDEFYVEHDIKEPTITRQIISDWRKTRVNDSEKTLLEKYCIWSQLAKFMCRNGHECYVPMMPRAKKYSSKFTPYVFSHKDVSAMFAKADALRIKSANKNCCIIFIPTLLRLLYSTGLRISEALVIKVKDVHFKEGYIFIDKSKNGEERLVPLDESMTSVLKQYMTYRNKIQVKCVSSPSSFLFVKSNGQPASGTTVYGWFRYLLKQCGIPFIGDSKGPRLHDFRHTFAVHSLANMARNGMDLYTSMPILSTCLGHRNLSSTELYVRLTTEMFPELAENTDPINSFVYPTIRKELQYED